MDSGGINMARLVLPQADGNAAGQVVLFALRAFHSDDQHVLGEPAFRARLLTGDAQCVALLAKQRVAAITRTETLDQEFFGEMHDEAVVRDPARR